MELYPDADILIHPESEGSHSPRVLSSDRCFMYSTAGILSHARESEKKMFVIATEPETLHVLRKENPGKTFIAIQPDNRCFHMKQTGLWEVLEALRHNRYEVKVPAEIREKALLSIERMLAVG